MGGDGGLLGDQSIVCRAIFETGCPPPRPRRPWRPRPRLQLWRGVREACFPYGNTILRAGVAHGKLGFPYGKRVSALAWRTGSMLPVREFIPVGRCGIREAWLLVRETWLCAGVGYGKHASRTGIHSLWHTGRLASRTGILFLHWRGVWEAHPVWGSKFIKQKGEGWVGGGAVGRPKHCMPGDL